jgi:hypothetical protein
MKLLNKGGRTIDGKFKPGMVAIFPDAAGKKLLGLYPKELIDVDNVTAPDGEVTDFTAKSKGGRPAKATKATPPTDDELTAALKE